MGMFDTFNVEQGNPLGLPAGSYQSKDLNCGLDIYKITNKNEIVIEYFSPDFRNWQQQVTRPKYKNAVMKGLNGVINIYGDVVLDSKEQWVEYDLHVTDGLITHTNYYGYAECDLNLETISWENPEEISSK